MNTKRRRLGPKSFFTVSLAIIIFALALRQTVVNITGLDRHIISSMLVQPGFREYDMPVDRLIDGADIKASKENILKLMNKKESIYVQVYYAKAVAKYMTNDIFWDWKNNRYD